VVLASEPAKVKPWTEEQAAEVWRLHQEGESDTAIAGALWHRTSYYLDRVRAILADHAQADDPDQDGDGDREPRPVDWCEFCERTPENTLLTTFAECTGAGCNVAVCSSCADERGRCPDCQEADD